MAFKATAGTVADGDVAKEVLFLNTLWRRALAVAVGAAANIGHL